VTEQATIPNPVATPRVAAGALFSDQQGRALLVRPHYKTHWDIPGGYVEPGEAPRAAATREITEELGIRVEVGELLCVDWAPHPDEGDKLLFIFDGGQLRAEQVDQIRFVDGEITEYRFATSDEIDELTIPRLARRLRAAIEAQATQCTVYLENGVGAGPAAGRRVPPMLDQSAPRHA